VESCFAFCVAKLPMSRGHTPDAESHSTH